MANNPSSKECLNGHAMPVCGDLGSWYCDLCNRKQKNCERWRCGQCDYDICFRCLPEQVEFNSAVYDAAGGDDLEQLRQMLAAHGDLIDAPNPNERNRTPFHKAALCGRVAFVDALIQSGSKAIDVPDDDGWTPMHAAASQGHVGIVEALSRSGSEAIDTNDKKDQTPFLVATSNGHIPVIEELLRLGSKAIEDPDNHDAFVRCAVKRGDCKLLGALIELGVTEIDSTDEHMLTPLHVAAQLGFANIIEVLVHLANPDIDSLNDDMWTPVHSAAYRGHAHVIKTLVRLGSQALDMPAEFCCPDTDFGTPMELAAINGHANVIETLVRLGSTTIDTVDEEDGRTPLHRAALNGHVGAIQTLVRLGSKAIDSPDNGGCTPMQLAAFGGQADAIETLAHLGSQAIGALDNKGNSLVYYAVRLEHPFDVEVVELLVVRLGSRAIDTPNHKGRTPMHAAASRNKTKVLVLLVRLGSQALDAADNDGQTPLHIAAQMKRGKSVALLMALGAKLDTSDNKLLAKIENLVPTPFTDDQVAELRYRTYFGTSLTGRLLFELRPSPNLCQNPTVRIPPVEQDD